MSTRGLMEHILEQKRFAVIGVSRNPEKFGRKVYSALKSLGYTVYPVNPNADLIGSDACYPSVDNIPGPIDCIVTVTPPEATEEAITAASRLKVRYIWMQPGSESNAAFNLARASSMQIVSGGPCIMVEAQRRIERERNAGAAP